MSSRISRGWQIAQNALKVLNSNKQLIIFPILSGLTLLVVLASFFIGIAYKTGFGTDVVDFKGGGLVYVWVFAFYLVSYFIVVFFNMALIHCATLYFKGEEPSVSKGIAFSFSRIGLIFSWAAFSATVGVLLQVLQDNLGFVGKLLTGFLGLAWSVATFFAIPVIAYEQVNPVDAVKRSTEILRDKWGESLVANFSFSLIMIVAMAIIGVVAIAFSELVNMYLGIGIFVAGVMLTAIVSSALKSILISAAYNNMDGDIGDHFNQQLLDGLFRGK